MYIPGSGMAFCLALKWHGCPYTASLVAVLEPPRWGEKGQYSVAKCLILPVSMNVDLKARRVPSKRTYEYLGLVTRVCKKSPSHMETQRESKVPRLAKSHPFCFKTPWKRFTEVYVQKLLHIKNSLRLCTKQLDLS